MVVPIIGDLLFLLANKLHKKIIFINKINMRKVSLLLTLAIIPLFAFAQNDEPEINVAGIRFLDFKNDLPDNLLSTKSVVLMTLPPESKVSSIRSDWKPMAEEAQKVFKETGIDAAAYYFMEDVISGIEVRKSFAAEMKARGIENLILLNDLNVKIKGKESRRFVILVTDFNGGPTLMNNGQIAWKTQNKSLDKALSKISKGASKQRLVKENLMMVDYPELFRDIDLITGRRAETYSNSLNSDKIAFVPFPFAIIPNDRPGGIINKNIAKEAEEANLRAKANNNQLAELLKEYPFEYGLSSSPVDEQALLNQGYSYVVYLLHTSGLGIKYLLDYDIEEGVSDYITVKQKNEKTILRNIPTEAPVYKFYIKHLKTKDVYVGSRWDADETWQDALDNFITNVKKDFKTR